MSYRFLLFIILLVSINASANEILHVSFDVTRELFREVNTAFTKKYDMKIKIHQSHGGSGKQTSAIIHGLPANVVSLALPYHMDLLADKNLVAENWRDLYPNHSSPFITRIVFLVHKNNPKNIKDWSDLIKPGIKVITGNPKTSGGALWNYVAAWVYASKNHEDPENFMNKLYNNVPVLDSTARSSAITFIKRNVGDILITWESEAKYIISKFENDFDIIYPEMTIKIDIPVAVLLNKKHQDYANEYIKFLFSPEGQKIAGKYFYFSYNQKDKIGENIEDYFKWSEFKSQHFGNDGIFEQIYK
jgi:sulfate/thiosulfate transport system substrate-binding protein